MPSGSQITEDGDGMQDGGNSHNGINFTLRLQQFEKMQYQHRIRAQAQALSSNSSTTSLSKVS